ASQAGVLAELRQVHATRVRSFQIVNAVAATISSNEISRLRGNASVAAVVPDTFRRFASLGDGGGPALPTAAHRARATAVPQPSCPFNPNDPIIEPEARDVMNADAADQVVDGTGIRVGVIADGIDPNNPDLIRQGGQHVIFDYQDFSGLGPGAPTDGREA